MILLWYVSSHNDELDVHKLDLKKHLVIFYDFKFLWQNNT